MNGKYSEYDYMFSAAKLAVMLTSLAGPEKLEPMVEARTLSEAADRLSEFGITPVRTPNGLDVEATLTEFTAGKYALLREFCPDSELVDVCRLRYDCHNVKTAIKCRALGADAAKFVIDCGTIPAAQVITAATEYREGAFGFLPEKMAAAADRAVAELDATGAARTVDVLLDAACFADMKSAADAVGFAPACELVRRKIDLTNLLSVLRIGRIRRAETAASLLADSLVEGGTISTDRLRAAADPAAVALLAEEGGFARTAQAIRTAGTGASVLETVAAAADADFLARVRELTHFRQLGAYPLVAYVIGLEYEIKNVRIILSGKQTGADAQTIRDRLRRG